MKIKTKFVSLSLDIEEINEAITIFLASKGYEILEPINNEDIGKFLATDELVVSAQKLLVKNQFTTKQKYFPNSLISRIGARNTLDIFIANVEQKEMKNFLNMAYNKIDESDQRILNFAFEMDKPILSRVKTGSQINKEFNFETSGSIALRNAIVELSKQLELILLNELKNNTLIVKNRGNNKEEILKTKVVDIGFSVRTLNGLKSEDIETLSHLLDESVIQKIPRIRNIGQIAVKEINILKSLYKL